MSIQERIYRLEKMVQCLRCNNNGGGGTSIHNNLQGLQGGQTGQYYHLTQEEYENLGGIQSVQPGTNITVDNTDPLNPIVNSTGGGSGETEIPDWQEQSYSQGYIVARNGGIWRSEVDGNETDPIVTGGGSGYSSWEEISPFSVKAAIYNQNDPRVPLDFSNKKLFEGSDIHPFSSPTDALGLTFNVGDILFFFENEAPLIAEVSTDILPSDTASVIKSKITPLYITYPVPNWQSQFPCENLLTEMPVLFIDSNESKVFKLISCPYTDFPQPIQDSNWTLLANIGGGTTGDYIPLSGTEVGKPVTGHLQLDGYPYVSIYSGDINGGEKYACINFYKDVDGNGNCRLDFGADAYDWYGYPYANWAFGTGTCEDELTEVIYNGFEIQTVNNGNGGLGVGLFANEDYSDVAPNNKLIYTQRSYVDRANSYSTTETKTGGTWIDGKPIYRKVFELEISNTIGEGMTSAVNLLPPSYFPEYIDKIISQKVEILDNVLLDKEIIQTDWDISLPPSFENFTLIDKYISDIVIKNKIYKIGEVEGGAQLVCKPKNGLLYANLYFSKVTDDFSVNPILYTPISGSIEITLEYTKTTD